ncbi:MAG: Nif3-like dinuclear metal center hexameric protein [Bacteroidaceae bacterium]|nr:Nif3-like dinuclear metal center hexameric protein [Bacteroidaceae bacterium]
MKIREIIDALERFAPLPLQDDYDNSGLQVGTTQAEASGALLCLDVTPEVIREATRKGCNLVLSHHPLLFHPLKQVSDTDYNGQIVIEAIRHGITIYASHTNLDNAAGGVSMRMAQVLGLSDCRTLDDNGNGTGAGVIGNLPQAIEEQALLEMVRDRFHTSCLRHNGLLGHPVRRIALCGGSGAFLIDKAVSEGADAFITGEISYHRFFGYDGVLKLIDAGHFETEQYTVGLIHDILSESFPDMRIIETSCRTNPVNYF